jgi:hypothetical protein
MPDEIKNKLTYLKKLYGKELKFTKVGNSQTVNVDFLSFIVEYYEKGIGAISSVLDDMEGK